MAALDHAFRYSGPSKLRDSADGRALALVSEAAPESSESGRFLSAKALVPDVTAKGLRAVSDIVGSRFYVPPAMLARILREADPVATVGPSAVRFEGFSACCSTYIRLDLYDDALEVSERRHGTTNVDFGAELRGALASVGRETALGLSIGARDVTVARDGHEIIEKKVPLPVRWLKGFAEVQVVIAEMEPVFRLPRVAAQRYLRALPRGKADHQLWVSYAGGTARVSTRETQGAVPLRGVQRLRVLEPLTALANDLQVHVNQRTGATSWALDFGSQRLWLVLNAEPWRGFSGDGGVLSKIASEDDTAVAAVRAQLNWQDRIDMTTLAGATGLTISEISRALAKLAAIGLLGFDLHSGCYFHRVLPFDMKRVEGLNPRLKAARGLVDKGTVYIKGDSALVESETAVHTVSPSEEGWRCTCPWFAKNGIERGPCKHVLAVEILLDQ
ncbi:SWIM zinc finger family protein [Ovoidimarina sediminis]|uniref:SWIM zinc finger family protein n=1 Tax=Ovoidimarina sediminis TaxID=3079856 RepID=UPI00291543C3|nr:SWIM zinc finger family protein [Rhodophyticola sp. MJ-SS7]MDU8946400.1 SWIM zinc finger family protein [Rhodophyticola sp. MJ-SS7]